MGAEPYLPGSEYFIKEGFAVAKGFLSTLDVEQLSELVESALKTVRDTVCERPHNVLVPLRWKDAIIEMLITPTRREILEDMVGAIDLKWISGYVSIKEPHSPPLWWHQDWWCWDHPISFVRQTQQLAVLCYLRKTNKSNGALRVLPGSHHHSAPIHGILPEAHGLVASQIEASHPAMSDLPGQVTISAEAGDAVVLDYRLLHGTHSNASAVRRDCVLLSFTPSWKQLPRDIKAHLISHPAQPSDEEKTHASIFLPAWLPQFHGARQDLSMNRNAPVNFRVLD